MSDRTVAVWDGKVRIRVQSKGSGPALVFFHGPWGLTWDPFLDELAKSFTVHAPEHPGTTPETPDDVYQLDGLWDLVLCYDELLQALGLEGAALVGHSFGGMLACELAAAYPARARRLGLIAPLGFWRDADRVVNWMMLDPARLPEYVFRDPKGEAAQRLFGSTEPEARRTSSAPTSWPECCASFSWDRGAPRVPRGAPNVGGVWGAISGPPTSLDVLGGPRGEARRAGRSLHGGVFVARSFTSRVSSSSRIGLIM